MNRIKWFISALFLACAFIACKKEAGEGGNSSIHGYVSVIMYDAFYTDTIAVFDGRDEDVYIIYGDDISYGDHIKSGYDGKFEFKFLREGSYKIYLFSDTVKYTSDSLAKIVVLKNVEITDKKQSVNAGTFEIRKNK